MLKRIAAFFIAALFLMFVLTSAAEDFEEFDDFGDDEEFVDLGEYSEEDVNNVKSSMDALSGYHDQTILEDGNFRYEPLTDGKACQVTRYTGYDEDVSVPEKLQNFEVKALYQTFSDCNLLESVVLPETIELIDNMAFWKCTNLEHVEMQEGLTRIGRCSFGGCTALKNIEFPESLETVDDMVFISCIELTELSFGKNLKSIGSQAFTGCIKLEKVKVPKGAVIAEDAFEQCPKLSEIEYYDVEEST